MSYWYLATPYSKYPHGKQAAFEEACRQAALLLKAGIHTFSPIAHSHPIAVAGNLPLGHEFDWLGFDMTFIQHARGMIIGEMEGWSESYGIGEELKEFRRLAKPIINMIPGRIPANV